MFLSAGNECSQIQLENARVLLARTGKVHPFGR